MPTQKWVCDTCEEPYDTEEEAEDCETLHATPEEREAGQEWTVETVAARLGITVEEFNRRVATAKEKKKGE